MQQVNKVCMCQQTQCSAAAQKLGYIRSIRLAQARCHCHSEQHAPAASTSVDVLPKNHFWKIGMRGQSGSLDRCSDPTLSCFSSPLPQTHTIDFILNPKERNVGEECVAARDSNWGGDTRGFRVFCGPHRSQAYTPHQTTCTPPSNTTTAICFDERNTRSCTHLGHTRQA